MVNWAVSWQKGWKICSTNTTVSLFMKQNAVHLSIRLNQHLYSQMSPLWVNCWSLAYAYDLAKYPPQFIFVFLLMRLNPIIVGLANFGWVQSKCVWILQKDLDLFIQPLFVCRNLVLYFPSCSSAGTWSLAHANVALYICLRVCLVVDVCSCVFLVE